MNPSLAVPENSTARPTLKIIDSVAEAEICMSPEGATRLLVLAVELPPKREEMSYVIPDVVLPTCDIPAVTAARKVPWAPRPERQRNDVSDSHSVPSHPVCDSLVIDVITNDPKFAPCKVKLVFPVPGRFACLDVLIIGLSAVNRFVTVAMSPMVRETLELAVTAVEAWHCSAESDCHRVISHVVTDKRAMPEYLITPKFCPTSVSVSDPVVGLFPVTFSAGSRANATMLARSVVTASVKVPIRGPAVKVTRCCDILSDRPTLHMMIVSDAHSVDSNAVNPRRPLKEGA